MCVHETVVQRALCNFTTFHYHWKIYRFQFPCFATSIYNGYRIIFAPRYFRVYLLVCLVLNSPKQYCGMTKRAKKTGANSSLEQCTQYMYKHICFPPQLALILAAAFVIVFGGIIYCFQLCILKCVGNGRYRPHLTRRCCLTVKRMIGRLSCNLFGAGSIVRKSWISCDPTALAFIVQQSHIHARYLKRFNLFTSCNGRSESCEFRTSTSSYAIILTAVYELYLFFFGRTNILSLVHQLWKGL